MAIKSITLKDSAGNDQLSIVLEGAMAELATANKAVMAKAVDDVLTRLNAGREDGDRLTFLSEEDA